MLGNISNLYPLELVQPKNPLAYILIADDNSFSLKIRSCRLAKMGFNVETAIDGEEAILKVKENPDKYDVILMNYKMPIYDGMQATRIIRRRYNFKKLIIGYSATYFLFDEYQDAGISAGMDSCVDAEEMLVINELIKLLFIEPEKEKYKAKTWLTKLKELILQK